jgi:hypothetical protein
VFEAAASPILYREAVVADLASFLTGISPANANLSHSKRSPKTKLLSLTHRLHLVHPPFRRYALFSDILGTGDWAIDSKPEESSDHSEAQRRLRHQRFINSIVDSAGAADSDHFRSAFNHLESVSVARWDNELWEPECEPSVDVDILKHQKDTVVRSIAAACHTWYSHTDVGPFTSSLKKFHELPSPHAGHELPIFVHHVAYRRRLPPLLAGTWNVVVYKPVVFDSPSNTVAHLGSALSTSLDEWWEGIRGSEEDAKSTLNRTMLEIYGLVGPVAIVRTGPGFFDRRQAPLSDAMIEEGLRTVRLLPNAVRAKKGSFGVDRNKYDGALPIFKFGKSQDAPSCGACGDC